MCVCVCVEMSLFLEVLSLQWSIGGKRSAGPSAGNTLDGKHVEHHDVGPEFIG